MSTPRPYLANSAATLTSPDTHFDLVRPGIAVYGLSPVPDQGAEELVKTALSDRQDLAANQDVLVPEQAVERVVRWQIAREVIVVL